MRPRVGDEAKSLGQALFRENEIRVGRWAELATSSEKNCKR